MRTLAVQGMRFTLAGAAQFALDWGVFSLLHATTGLTAGANIAGRLAGALLGFWLNGRFTFAPSGEQRLGTRRFTRYFALWITLTIVSTTLVKLVDLRYGGSVVYFAKPTIEATLAIASFLASRYWVYE